MRSARGAFDLPSILVGVVVVGILAAGVLAAIFGVIPFAQDKAAVQDISAVRTAEGVAKAKDAHFLDSAGLHSAGHLPSSSKVAVGTDPAGSCYAAFAKSGTGSVFYATDRFNDPLPFTAGTDTGCLDSLQTDAIISSLGGPVAEPAAPPVGGQMASWGSSDSALGNGSVGSLTPAAVNTGDLAGKTVTNIGANGSASCAVADAKAYCWGINWYGQLGNGSPDDSMTPAAVDTTGVLSGKAVTSISSGDLFACAVAGGKAYCWGYNEYGQLGNGSNVNSSVPVAVGGLLASKTVTSITASSDHACAIAGGKAYCWGGGYAGGPAYAGALGDGSTSPSSTPVAVGGLLASKTVTSISAGELYTCAVADGAAYCWGVGVYWQLGNNGGGASTLPVAVDATDALNGKTVTSVSSAYDHSCVIAGGEAYCWGGVSAPWSLGDGGDSPSPVPVKVDTSGALNGLTVTSISAGSDHTCAIAGGSAYCWGSGASGQLGNNSHKDEMFPVAVGTSGVLNGKTSIGISATASMNLLIYKD